MILIYININTSQCPFSSYHQTGYTYPTQTGTDIVPDPDAPTSDLLTHSQLQKEKWDADDEEEDEVRNQISTW